MISIVPEEATVVLFSASLLRFFSVNTITHEPLQLAWWNFARTHILTTSRSLLNIKVIGQRGVYVLLCACYWLNQLVWIHETQHMHRFWYPVEACWTCRPSDKGRIDCVKNVTFVTCSTLGYPRAVLSLQQKSTFLCLLSFASYSAVLVRHCKLFSVLREVPNRNVSVRD